MLKYIIQYVTDTNAQCQSHAILSHQFAQLSRKLNVLCDSFLSWSTFNLFDNNRNCSPLPGMGNAAGISGKDQK